MFGVQKFILENGEWVMKDELFHYNPDRALRLAEQIANQATDILVKVMVKVMDYDRRSGIEKGYMATFTN